MLTRSVAKLTHEAAQRLVAAAAKAATAIGQPEVIVVVDEACGLLALLRMDGARLLSIESAQRKAVTAANSGVPTGKLPQPTDMRAAFASDGRITNLEGGLPIIVDGHLVGGIGVGSGSPAQDVAVATAALSALGLAVP